MTVLEEIKSLLLKYNKEDQYMVTIKLVMERNEEKEILKLVDELYEQICPNYVKCRVVFGDDLVDKILEYKNHKWELGIEYWHVEYRNVESQPRWCVVKCFADVSESDIKSKMLNDSNVAEIYSLTPTTGTEYSVDFTIN